MYNFNEKYKKKKQYYHYSRLLENIYSFNVLFIFVTFPDLENTQLGFFFIYSGFFSGSKKRKMKDVLPV